MVTKKKVAPKPKVAPKKKPTIKNDKATRDKAIADLGINVPIYRTRVVGGRLELFCYGGRVLFWPAEQEDPPHAAK
ncbi:hypothetical protein ACFLWA_12690 [Chloroflexota bacterium]